jgi:hypothetical protein
LETQFLLESQLNFSEGLFVEIGMSGMLLNLRGGCKEVIVKFIDFVLELFLGFVEFVFGLLKFEFEGGFFLKDFVILSFEFGGSVGT